MRAKRSSHKGLLSPAPPLCICVLGFSRPPFPPLNSFPLHLLLHPFDSLSLPLPRPSLPLSPRGSSAVHAITIPSQKGAGEVEGEGGREGGREKELREK